MPVENLWIIQDRVLLTRLIGTITADELAESSRVGTRMIESGIAPVYSLVDMSEMRHYPMRISDFRSSYQQKSSENLALIILYGIPNPLANSLASFFTKLTRTRYKIAANQAEALALVETLERENPSAAKVQ